MLPLNFGENIFFPLSLSLWKNAIILIGKKLNLQYLKANSEQFQLKRESFFSPTNQAMLKNLVSSCWLLSCLRWVNSHCSMETVCGHLASCVKKSCGQQDWHTTDVGRTVKLWFCWDAEFLQLSFPMKCQHFSGEAHNLSYRIK